MAIDDLMVIDFVFLFFDWCLKESIHVFLFFVQLQGLVGDNQFTVFPRFLVET